MDRPTPFDQPFPIKDRRRFYRQGYSIPVRVMGEEAESHFFSIDIGAGGIRLFSRKPLEIEKVYEFDLFIAAIHHPIQVTGKLAWQRKLSVADELYEVAFMFGGISKEQREQLQEYAKGWRLLQQNERRKFLRVPRLLQANVIGEFKETSLSGYVLDFSEDGARFACPSLVEEKSIVMLKIELEQGTTTSLSGRVAWGKPSESLGEILEGMRYIHGVKFQVQSVELQALINSYVKFQNETLEANLVETLLNLGSGEK